MDALIREFDNVPHWVHKVYYETCALFSSTTSQIDNKYKREQMKLVLLYKSVIDLNKFLFDTTVPKIVHS